MQLLRAASFASGSGLMRLIRACVRSYGTPQGICKETAPNSGVFTRCVCHTAQRLSHGGCSLRTHSCCVAERREWTKATVSVDCGKWEGTITMKK